MAENRLRIIAVLALLTLFAGSIVFTVTGALQSTVDPLVWLLGVGVWVVAMTIAIVITVPAPSGTRLSLGIGAVVAGSILVDDTMALASIVAISLTLSWLIQHNLDVGHARTDGDLLADSVAMAVYVFLYTVAFDALGTTFTVGYSWMVVAAVAAAGLSWFIIRALVAAFVGLERTELAGRYLWLLALEDWAVVISMFAAGTLFGLTWPVMGLWSVAVALLPYAFGHLAFERYHSTRVTYGQTIRALAQIPEVAGLAPLGHATRTADLAVAIAQELGLHPNDVIELEYAALMHDVGRITLNEPAILKAGYTDQDIARWGAQIIAEAPYLDRVSELVEQQHRPYRSPGIEIDPDIPVPSKIIKIASAYDQGQIELGLSPVESLEKIHQGSAYEFDPAIAASLRRVLVFRGEIPY
ncbi:hypothetical protein MNBD_ACTINO01-1616 [hydrothermal vent metagenome]|uniref:HD domain-containing protein n=2 Tax=hydrothermal vent metagenome TaxID=652676 RepID=A0A3B0SJM4_9ZZZZ